jgi:hypothetical protein
LALTPGYFPSNYFPHDYWQLGNQYWTEYGAAAPPAPAPAIASDMYPHGRRRRKKAKKTVFDDREFLEMLTEFVEII